MPSLADEESRIRITIFSPNSVGSVLTLTNSIGFGISIVSILLFVALTDHVPLRWLLTRLAIGPALGLWALRPLVREGV